MESLTRVNTLKDLFLCVLMSLEEPSALRLPMETRGSQSGVPGSGELADRDAGN